MSLGNKSSYCDCSRPKEKWDNECNECAKIKQNKLVKKQKPKPFRPISIGKIKFPDEISWKELARKRRTNEN